MSVQRTTTRLLAAAIRGMTPSRRRDWALAMTRELDEVADDRAALGWAFGCLAAAVVERIRSMRILMIGARLALAGASALFALGAALPVALVLAYRNGWTPVFDAAQGAVAESHLQGDGQSRFIALIESVPDWRLGLGVVSIALCLGAGVLVVLRHRLAPWMFAAAVILSAAGMAYSHTQALVQEVFSPAELRTDYVSLAIQIVVAAAMFWAVRPREAGPIV